LGYIMMGPITVSGGGEASDVQVVALPDGGFAVAYTDTSWDNDGTDITLAMFDADGTRWDIGVDRPGYLLVNGEGSGSQSNPSLGVLANGTLVVSWELGEDTFVQIVSPTGELLGGASNWGWMTDTEIAVLANGDVAGVGDHPDGEITQLTGELVRSTYGDDQADAFTGDLLVDIVEGRGGSDTLFGADGDDYLDGGAKGDFLQGGRGADTINGADGFDTASWIEADGVVINLNDEGDNAGGALGDIIANVEGFELSNGADVFRGDDYAHLVKGLKGADLLRTGGARDTLEGGDGDDTLIGGGGGDSMTGGAGDDRYQVDHAGDVVVELAKGGVDTVVTSIGFDFDATHIENIELAGESAGAIHGNGLANVLKGNLADNLLSGRGGNDTLEGGLGRDTLDGGADRDTAAYTAAGAAVTVNLAKAQASGGAGADTLVAIENVLGSAFDDAITGDSGANALDGGAGADTLSGGQGGDTLIGGDGLDTVSYAAAPPRRPP
jgi:Ca2+-binding RTX toxin-like protein